MNAKQVTAAIKAISPDLTVRRADGDWRVSIAPVAIRRAYPDLTCGEAIERNESLACYESDSDCAIDTARALWKSWKREISPPAPRRDNVEYHAGKAAGEQGKPLSDCPYLADGERAARWNLGWQDADKVFPAMVAINRAGDYVAVIRIGDEIGLWACSKEIGLWDSREEYNRLSAKAKAVFLDKFPEIVS